MDKLKTADDYILKATGDSKIQKAYIKAVEATSEAQKVNNLKEEIAESERDLIDDINTLKNTYNQTFKTGFEEQLAAAMGVTTAAASGAEKAQKGYFDFEKPQIAMLAIVAAMQLFTMIIICSKLK